MKKAIPAVSIILPMYNMENYIGECLDSILAQTFTDYEAIVVDDCSTDNCCTIVENYQSKFGDKLKLLRSKVNSGGHVGVPRNKGLMLSLGKYVYFVDSDDALIDNNLEIFFNTAEKFGADIVHTDKYLRAPEETVTTDRSKLQIVTKSDEPDIDEPTPMSDDLTERVDEFVTGKMRWEPWNNFIRRDLLMEHDIRDPKLSVADDLAFFIMMYLKAKKIVRIPDALYVWRIRSSSNCRKQLSAPQIIHKRAGDAFLGVKCFEDFMNKHDIFTDDIGYRFQLFDFITNNEAGTFMPLYAQVPAHDLDQFVRKELDDIGKSVALTAYIFARMNVLNIMADRQESTIRQMNAHIQNLNLTIQQNSAIQHYQTIVQKQAEQIRQLQTQLENSRNFLK